MNGKARSSLRPLSERKAASRARPSVAASSKIWARPAHAVRAARAGDVHQRLSRDVAHAPHLIHQLTALLPAVSSDVFVASRYL